MKHLTPKQRTELRKQVSRATAKRTITGKPNRFSKPVTKVSLTCLDGPAREEKS
jgi:hypothetical protein